MEARGRTRTELVAHRNPLFQALLSERCRDLDSKAMEREQEIVLELTADLELTSGEEAPASRAWGTGRGRGRPWSGHDQEQAVVLGRPVPSGGVSSRRHLCWY